MQEFYQSDNSGNRVAPGHMTANPIVASGVTLDVGKDIDGEETVVSGQMYIVTTCGDRSGRWLFSVTGVLTVAANIEWVCPQGESFIIKIPHGVTTLYYLQKDKSGFAHMRTLAS